ncbi:DUF305 domain-containing protein [Aeromicrobium sp. Sec7.5]|uniref:DUF305 domain-containing protein n=1 Tax=Aeromicrobium sp. Sec7.5 TaxID=3121276 RepID=UPI002FE4E83E
MRTRLIAAVIAATTTLALTACSGDDSSASLPDDVTEFDVTFAQEMIPHHEQATEMAALAQDRTTSPEILDIASRIEAAQDPEIETMTTWLQEWGVSEESTDEHSEMNHGQGSESAMPGMMSDEDMSDLEDATGTEFDQMFLTMMIEHHEGAIIMAKAEIDSGTNPDAIALAEQIEAAQTTEIAEMEALLAP